MSMSIIFVIMSVYTTIQKFGVGEVSFKVLIKVSYSPGLHLFDQKYSKKCNIIKNDCN